MYGETSIKRGRHLNYNVCGSSPSPLGVVCLGAADDASARDAAARDASCWVVDIGGGSTPPCLSPPTIIHIK